MPAFDDDDAPLRDLHACLEQLERTLGIARNLSAAGQSIDLSGLESQVGFVCARALDLPPEQGRTLRPALIGLRDELDAVACLLGAGAPPDA